jgi:hypothetical protein
MPTYHRYFVVDYIKKPDGKTDEVVQVTKRLRNRDISMASVILDFKDQIVVKASLGSNTIPRDWPTIYSYYKEHYTKIFETLDMIYRVTDTNSAPSQLSDDAEYLDDQIRSHSEH